MGHYGRYKGSVHLQEAISSDVMDVQGLATRLAYSVRPLFCTSVPTVLIRYSADRYSYVVRAESFLSANVCSHWRPAQIGMALGRSLFPRSQTNDERSSGIWSVRTRDW